MTDENLVFGEVSSSDLKALDAVFEPLTNETKADKTGFITSDGLDISERYEPLVYTTGTYQIHPKPGGRPTSTASGHSNTLYFTGKDGGNVYCGKKLSLGGSNTFTFEAWLNPDKRKSGMIFNKENQYEWRLDPVGGSSNNYYIRFAVRGAWHSSWQWHALKNAQEQIPYGKWTHVALTYDKDRSYGTVRLYINGKQAGNRACPMQTSFGHTGPDSCLNNPVTESYKDARLRIGARGSLAYGTIATGGRMHPYSLYTGEMDEVRIWNVCRTQAEIKETSGIYPDTTILTGKEPGLIGYWNFENIEGNNVPNLCGDDGTGTIEGQVISTTQPLEGLEVEEDTRFVLNKYGEYVDNNPEVLKLWNDNASWPGPNNISGRTTQSIANLGNLHQHKEKVMGNTERINVGTSAEQVLRYGKIVFGKEHWEMIGRLDGLKMPTLDLKKLFVAKGTLDVDLSITPLPANVFTCGDEQLTPYIDTIIASDGSMDMHAPNIKRAIELLREDLAVIYYNNNLPVAKQYIPDPQFSNEYREGKPGFPGEARSRYLYWASFDARPVDKKQIKLNFVNNSSPDYHEIDDFSGQQTATFNNDLIIYNSRYNNIVASGGTLHTAVFGVKDIPTSNFLGKQILKAQESLDSLQARMDIPKTASANTFLQSIKEYLNIPAYPKDLEVSCSVNGSVKEFPDKVKWNLHSSICGKLPTMKSWKVIISSDIGQTKDKHIIEFDYINESKANGIISIDNGIVTLKNQSSGKHFWCTLTAVSTSSSDQISKPIYNATADLELKIVPRGRGWDRVSWQASISKGTHTDGNEYIFSVYEKGSNTVIQTDTWTTDPATWSEYVYTNANPCSNYELQITGTASSDRVQNTTNPCNGFSTALNDIAIPLEGWTGTDPLWNDVACLFSDKGKNNSGWLNDVKTGNAGNSLTSNPVNTADTSNLQYTTSKGGIISEGRPSNGGVELTGNNPFTLTNFTNIDSDSFTVEGWVYKTMNSENRKWQEPAHFLEPPPEPPIQYICDFENNSQNPFSLWSRGDGICIKAEGKDIYQGGTGWHWARRNEYIEDTGWVNSNGLSFMDNYTEADVALHPKNLFRLGGDDLFEWKWNPFDGPKGDNSDGWRRIPSTEKVAFEYYCKYLARERSYGSRAAFKASSDWTSHGSTWGNFGPHAGGTLTLESHIAGGEGDGHYIMRSDSPYRKFEKPVEVDDGRFIPAYWHHWAWVRDGTGTGNNRLYWNGNFIVKWTGNTPLNDGVWGADRNHANGLVGYMDQIRLTKKARYFGQKGELDFYNAYGNTMGDLVDYRNRGDAWTGLFRNWTHTGPMLENMNPQRSNQISLSRFVREHFVTFGFPEGRGTWFKLSSFKSFKIPYEEPFFTDVPRNPTTNTDDVEDIHILKYPIKARYFKLALDRTGASTRQYLYTNTASWSDSNGTIDLGNSQTITKIGTRPSVGGTAWVKDFTIEYSNDNINWSVYADENIKGLTVTTSKPNEEVSLKQADNIKIVPGTTQYINSNNELASGCDTSSYTKTGAIEYTNPDSTIKKDSSNGIGSAASATFTLDTARDTLIYTESGCSRIIKRTRSEPKLTIKSYQFSGTHPPPPEEFYTTNKIETDGIYEEVFADSKAKSMNSSSRGTIDTSQSARIVRSPGINMFLELTVKDIEDLQITAMGGNGSQWEYSIYGGGGDPSVWSPLGILSTKTVTGGGFGNPRTSSYKSLPAGNPIIIFFRLKKQKYTDVGVSYDVDISFSGKNPVTGRPWASSTNYTLHGCTIGKPPECPKLGKTVSHKHSSQYRCFIKTKLTGDPVDTLIITYEAKGGPGLQNPRLSTLLIGGKRVYHQNHEWVYTYGSQHYIGQLFYPYTESGSQSVKFTYGNWAWNTITGTTDEFGKDCI